MRTRWIVVFLLLIAGAAVLGFVVYSGIGARVKAATSLRAETMDRAVLSVSVVHPRSEALSEDLVLPGAVQAFVSAPIYARTNGYLKKWYFDIGAHVRAGQLLAEIETPEIDRQLDQARADLATAEANHALARNTAERYQSLAAGESVSKQDVEDKVGDLNARKAMLDSARFNVRRLEEMQHFQKIYCPFDGVVTARNTDIGQLIDAGANSPGKELFDISQTGELRVFVNVPQAQARAAKPGASADLTLQELPGKRFPAKVTRTAAAIDPTSRTLLTELDVDNSNGALLPGAYVLVHLKLAGAGRGVVLPVNTLIFRADGLRVAVVREGKAILVPITMGRDFGNEVEIVAGAVPEDAIIENPSDSLTSGAVVRIAGAAK